MIYLVLRVRETETRGSEVDPRERSELTGQASTEITTLAELKAAAKEALENCMCSSPTPSTYNVLVPNFLHLVRSYKQTKLSFVEAVCIKSYLLTQNPGERTFNNKYTPSTLILIQMLFTSTQISINCLA